MPAMIVTAHNPTTGPVVIDPSGRTLGGGEWGPVDNTTGEVHAARGLGSLITYGAPIDAVDADPYAVQASERAAALEARRALLAATPADDLHAWAVERGHLDADADDLRKAAMVDRLTWADTPLDGLEARTAAPADDTTPRAGKARPRTPQEA